MRLPSVWVVDDPRSILPTFLCPIRNILLQFRTENLYTERVKVS